MDFRLAELEENHMARKNSKQPAIAGSHQAVARNEKLPTPYLNTFFGEHQKHVLLREIGPRTTQPIPQF
jgi:hypothetical protein